MPEPSIMKLKSIILTILVIILAIAIYGYFKAAPSPSTSTENQPSIEVSPQSYNFGPANYGEKLGHAFTVTNIGNQTLEITKVATSCGCTTAEVSQTSILPGQQADLAVTYDTGVMTGAHAKGQQERIIYLKSNDPANPQVEVTITALVQ